MNGGPSPRTITSIVSRSSGMRLVAGQVAQVRPDADRAAASRPSRGRRLDGAPRAARRTRRAGMAGRAATRHDAASTAATRSIQAEIVAGPSSDELAIGEHAVGAAREGALAQLEVVVLADRQHARAALDAPRSIATSGS